MQMCLNNFQRNLVKMVEVLFVVRHSELAFQQLAAGKEREKKKGMAKDFDFQILVTYVVFKLTIQVESTTTPRPE